MKTLASIQNAYFVDLTMNTVIYIGNMLWVISLSSSNVSIAVISGCQVTFVLQTQIFKGLLI